VGWSGPSTRRHRCRVSWQRLRAGSASPSSSRAKVRRSPSTVWWGDPSPGSGGCAAACLAQSAGRFPEPEQGEGQGDCCNQGDGVVGPSTRRQRAGCPGLGRGPGPSRPASTEQR
jgi:hypothetical protein